MNKPRKAAFILAASDNGTLIVPRFDYRMVSEKTGFGVGWFVLDESQYQADEDHLIKGLLDLRRKHFGEGVSVIDCGANVGAFSVSWARHMTSWGWLLAIEAQERLFYALAGNLTINNCLNAQALHAVAGQENGVVRVPHLDYAAPGSFGSLEMRTTETNSEEVGQTIDRERLVQVRAITIDSLHFPRLDLLKIDVEGMEVDVINGAADTIAKFHPIVIAEDHKAGDGAVWDALQTLGYKAFFPLGINLVAVHPSDPCLASIAYKDAA